MLEFKGARWIDAASLEAGDWPTLSVCLRGESYVMTIGVGFFDESTDEDTHGQCYVVAGFIAHNADTVQLELRWRDLLDRYNLEYFKASELSAGEGQFRQYRDDPSGKGFAPFSETEKQKLGEIKTAFIDAIVETSGLNGIGAAVFLPDYELILQDYPRANLSKPYYLAVNLVLMETGVRLCLENQNYTAQNKVFVRPVFDSHEDYSGQVKRGFDSFCRNNPISSQYILPPHYEDDKRYLTLQAADNLAFEIRKFATGQQKRIPMTRLRESGNILKMFKVNYASMKTIIEAQDPEFHLKPVPYTLADIIGDEPRIKKSVTGQ